MNIPYDFDVQSSLYVAKGSVKREEIELHVFKTNVNKAFVANVRYNRPTFFLKKKLFL